MKNFLLLLSVLFCSFQGMAQQLDDYLSAAFPTHMTAAADGKAVAWVFNDKGERNVFYAKAPNYEAQQLTQYKGDQGVDLGPLVFSPDGSTLLVVRGNPKNSSGYAANPAQLQENTQKKIHVVELQTGKSREFSVGASPVFSPDGKQVAFLQGGEVYLKALSDSSGQLGKPLFIARGTSSNLAFSPDGSYLAFVSARTDHSFVGLWNFAKKSLHFPEASLDHDSYPSWSPDGTQLAYLRVPNILNHLPFTSLTEANPWSIRVLQIATMTAEEVWRADQGRGSVLVDDLPASSERLWWTPDGQLVFPWEKNNWMQLYAVHPKTKQVKHLSPGEGQVEWVQTSYTKKELLVTHNIGNIDRRQVSLLDLSTLEMRLLSNPESIAWAPVAVEKGWACFESNWNQPGWPILHLSGKRKLLAEALFPKEFPKTFSKPQALTIQAKDGYKSFAQLFLPPNYDPKKKYPAVIFLHGGSRRQMLLGYNYGIYYSHTYGAQQYFASQGYIALTLNYRSGIGYGMDFREEKNFGAGGASEVQDVLAAADYLASRSDVDASRIAPWGGSYGGYLTAHALTQAPEKFHVGVDIHGVHNWNKDIPVFAPWYAPEKFPEMADLAFRSSPMAHVENWVDPVLLIHGDDDRNVLFSESVELAEVLRKQGVYVEQLVFPDEVHAFLLHQNWVKAFEATYRFITKHSLEK
jgi:dipeptidyl aminopeptidase/acylaminoacyl peptidase